MNGRGSNPRSTVCVADALANLATQSVCKCTKYIFIYKYIYIYIYIKREKYRVRGREVGIDK